VKKADTISEAKENKPWWGSKMPDKKYMYARCLQNNNRNGKWMSYVIASASNKEMIVVVENGKKEKWWNNFKF